MKSLYITSVERYSGKTAVCLGLGTHLKADGFTVGYLKPLSLQPWVIKGHIADEDAAFVKETLALPAQPWDLSPVVLTEESLHQQLSSAGDINLLDTVRQFVQKASADVQVLLLEGGGTLREGYIVGLPTPIVATAVGSDILTIVKYHDDVSVLDDTLASKARLGATMGGVLINRVPTDAMNFVTHEVRPYLERHNIPVYGILPEVRSLAALTVGELVDILNAEVLTSQNDMDAMVENLTVGAMNTEAALSVFRKQKNKAVITGGDRTDLQLAALETSTTCLILTGNLRPSPLIIRQAEEFHVSILLVPTNTMETVELIDQIYGKTRLGQPAKFREFQTLLDENFDYQRMYQHLGLNK